MGSGGVCLCTRGARQHADEDVNVYGGKRELLGELGEEEACPVAVKRANVFPSVFAQFLLCSGCSIVNLNHFLKLETF